MSVVEPNVAEPKKAKNRDLTIEEQMAASRLKLRWLAAKDSGKFSSQEELADAVDMTQSAASHYINGRRQLGLEALLKFCNALDCQPIDIYPELVSGVGAEDMLDTGEFIRLFMSAPDGIRAGVISILRGSSR
jgi:DNA-binding Xre family transcriptional regulator